MAPTRPLKHAQIECARTVPVPRESIQGPVGKFSGLKKEDITTRIVVDHKGRKGNYLPSTTGKKGSGRDSVVPTMNKAIMDVRHGDDGYTIRGIRAIERIMNCLSTQDLWTVIDKLGEGAGNEMGIKTDYVRGCCLDLMVALHKEICSRTVQERVNGTKRVIAAESGDIVRKAVPGVDARAVEHAVVEEAEDRRNRILFEGKMAEVIIKILEDESNPPELRGAAERAVYEIDSPLLREMIVSGIEDVQRKTGLMWGDTEQAGADKERARELILMTYLADIESAETQSA